MLHFTWEITLGQVLTMVTMLVSAIGVAAGVFVKFGRLQKTLEDVVRDSERLRGEFNQHAAQDQNTFRQIEGTLNQIVGQLTIIVQHHFASKAP